MTPIVFPLHHDGGKLRDDSELRFALRSIEQYFKDPFEIVIVGRKLPDWLQGVRHIDQPAKGLKTALRLAAEAFPNGFHWCYDDTILVRDTTAEEMKVTPACKGWSKPKTAWRRKLDSIRVRLLAEQLPAWDYSSPHGPYWFDKGMIDEAFRDWPGMASKFPCESWILSKRNWPRRHGVVKQYYGAFNEPPGDRQAFINFNNKGFTVELRDWLRTRFPDPSRFEKVWPVAELNDVADDKRVAGSVICIPSRPRWESQCIADMAEVGIDVAHFPGFDGHAGAMPPMHINRPAFQKDFKHEPLPGEIGCFASHIQFAQAFGSTPPVSPEFPDWRLVFEDDAVSVGMDAVTLRKAVVMAQAGGFDVVLLHTGRENRRGYGDFNVTAGGDVFTHAYLTNGKACREMSGWEMRHPIDHAISRSKKLKVGVLWGPAKFNQRSPGESEVSIHRERKAAYAGQPFALPQSSSTPASPTPSTMHSSVLQFVSKIATPARIRGKAVLEVGSFNVNGSARDIIQPLNPAKYHGVDLATQPLYVDEVLDASELIQRFGPESFDVVISTEMLEHAEDWQAAVLNMRSVLKPGGLLILTARGPGFPLHCHPHDHWRFSTDDIAAEFLDFATLYLCDDTSPSHPGFFYAGHKHPVTLTPRPEPMTVPFHSELAFAARLSQRRANPRPFAGPPTAFYHVAAMNNWKEVVTEQCEVFREAGLVPKAFLLGSKADEEWLRAMPVELIGRSQGLKQYETPTLEALWDWCTDRPDTAVIYCHTKGVSRPENPNVAPWRELMMRHVVERWRENLVKLAVADIAGVGWQGSRKRPHFSGNFWMARADWISHLPNPWDHRSAGGPTLQGQPWDRMHAEMWLGCRKYHHVENLCGHGAKLWEGPEVFQLLAAATKEVPQPGSLHALQPIPGLPALVVGSAVNDIGI